MVPSAPQAVMVNKVVVAYLNGSRLRGCVYDFSPLKDTFRLVLEGDASHQKFAEVVLKDLKAVFLSKTSEETASTRKRRKSQKGSPGEKLKSFSPTEKRLSAPRKRMIPRKTALLYSLRTSRATAFGYLWSTGMFEA